MYAFNLETGEWRVVDVDGDVPSSRCVCMVAWQGEGAAVMAHRRTIIGVRRFF